MWLKIKRIEEIRKERDVVDIEVKDNHNFILENGILSHNSSFVDINIIRMASAFLFKKLTWEESNVQSDRSTDILMRYVNAMEPVSKEETLFWDGVNWYKFRNFLPSFWSDSLSRGFKKMTYAEAIDYAVKLFDRGLNPKEIVRELKVRGIDCDTMTVEAWIDDPKHYKKLWTDWEKGKRKSKPSVMEE